MGVFAKSQSFIQNRKRSCVYLLCGASMVLLGLFVHVRGDWLAPAVRDVVGDALWATMLACWISAIVPRQQAALRYLSALVICFAVEASQLWHTPVLEYGRSTRFGRLVLGSGFDPRDFAAYTLGIVVFIGFDRYLIMRSRRAT